MTDLDENHRDNQEYNEASDFVSQFDNVVLDPLKRDKNEDGPLSQTFPSHCMFVYGEGEHTYNNFNCFGKRSPEEKLVEKGVRSNGSARINARDLILILVVSDST